MSKTKTALSPADITRRLKSLPSWKEQGNELVRVFEFSSYLDGLAFVNRLARESDRVDHHPTLLLEYKKVTVTFSTHSAGGITELDFDSAGTADALASN